MPALNRRRGGRRYHGRAALASDALHVVDNAGDTTVELAGGGVDTVESSVSWTQATDTENASLDGHGG